MLYSSILFKIVYLPQRCFDMGYFVECSILVKLLRFKIISDKILIIIVILIVK